MIGILHTADTQPWRRDALCAEVGDTDLLVSRASPAPTPLMRSTSAPSARFVTPAASTPSTKTSTGYGAAPPGFSGCGWFGRWAS